eukprot:CAMPEP_0115110432 /NCGR_PEP_ID=MMETSP0227-20121206/39376_1 /TAXON_ID=89957 /ORGANISM="Polarella glacialis, Strain CCMP 1383" /LENGTH=86 /DNA_ID=CAMNT_0002509477 /DNA_START=262 /DNA_END=519 /DNA_ORIENTATION=-
MPAVNLLQKYFMPPLFVTVLRASRLQHQDAAHLPRQSRNLFAGVAKIGQLPLTGWDLTMIYSFKLQASLQASLRSSLRLTMIHGFE